MPIADFISREMSATSNLIPSRLTRKMGARSVERTCAREHLEFRIQFGRLAIPENQPPNPAKATCREEKDCNGSRAYARAGDDEIARMEPGS